MNIAKLHAKFLDCRQEISTDTRTLIPGAMFFAWKGEYANGNNYINDALKKGARYVVCDQPGDIVDERCIVVDDTIAALQQLARYHRLQFDIPIVAIGGSNGKTTTKELLAHTLRQQKDTVASYGSMNNHTGVPLTLLRICQATDIVVLEIGANHIGEIRDLCEIAQPTHGLITNIGRDHIGLFDGVDGILQANLELYTYIQSRGGTMFVNKHDHLLHKYIVNVPTVYYGVGLQGESGIHSQHSLPYVSGLWKHHVIQTQLTGEYNLENVIAAITVAKFFAIQDQSIIAGIEQYIPITNRSKVVKAEHETILIKDYYNANRTSMELALKNLASFKDAHPKKKTIAVLGDMLELGEYAHIEHQAVVDCARSLNIDIVILIGPEFLKTKHVDMHSFNDVQHAREQLKLNQFDNAVVLFKASNGTGLGTLFNALEFKELT